MPVPQKVGRPDVFYFILKKKTCENNFLGKKISVVYKKIKNTLMVARHVDYCLIPCLLL